MNFRIIVERDASANVVRVCGRLAGEAALGALLHECEPISAALVIDLSDLRFADEEALRTLHSLREKGAKLRGVTPYISLLMGS